MGDNVRIDSDSGILTLSGGIVANAATNRNLTIGGSGNVTVTSPIGGSSNPIGSPTSNITSLTKDGSGTVTLSGTNTYAGATTVNNGLLVINNSAALPTGSALAIGAGGSVVLGDPVLGGSAIVEGSGLPGSPAAGDIHAVPEPGTLAAPGGRSRLRLRSVAAEEVRIKDECEGRGGVSPFILYTAPSNFL